MSVCERIDAILEERGMSRRTLAEMSGIPPSSLQSAMERNTGLFLDMLLPISDALGVSVESLDGTEESQNPFLLSRIKLLCLESGFTFKTLEKELGFGNGVIRRWDKSSPSISAVTKVAKHFNVSWIGFAACQAQKQGIAKLPPSVIISVWMRTPYPFFGN